MLKNYLNMFIVVLLLVILFYYVEDRKIINGLINKIPNIYLSPENRVKSSLLWINHEKDYFTRINWPNTINFDRPIKQDILNQSIKLKLNEAIIDCGAHIGDMTIPIAHALKVIGRNDIIVYALDPSKEKCKYIEYLVKINNLTNVKVICCGLYSKKIELYPHIPLNLNTGATVWSEEKVDENNNKYLTRNNESSLFVTLDSLIKSKQINHTIKVIHLDVEGHEDQAIIGGYETIKKWKPYISLETNTDERTGFENILKNNYKFVKRLNANNCFSSMV